MKTKKILFVLSVFLLVSTNFFAQETKKIVLTVDSAVQYALDNSRTLKSAAIDLEMKTRQKKTAWNVFLPSVSVNAIASRSNEYSNMMDSILPMLNPGYVPTDPTEKDYWTEMGQISASLPLSLALIDGIKATKANYEAGLITWEQSLKETERDVQKMFYALLLQQESLALQKQTLENAKNRYEQAKINFSNGLVPELSVLQAQVSYENQKPSIMKQEQALKQQISLFAFILGLPFNADIELQGEINPVFLTLNPEELVQQHLMNRLDVKTLQKNIELLKIQLSASRMQAYTPALVLSYGFQPIVKDEEDNWFDKDNITDGGNFSATLSFNITNMLPFSSNGIAMKNTKANIEKLQITLDTVLQNGEMEIYTLIDNLNQSRSAIEASKMSIQLAKKAYDMTMQAYDSGTKELLDVRDAESQYNQAQLGLANESFNYISSVIELEYALNTRLR
ncbi:MAG: TolC family protein [Spirochaetaceae bacterium]|nr:TolC family protein [Spirochaetaceae bacterium]